MAITNEEAKKSLHLVIKNSDGSIDKVIDLQDVQVGTTSSPKDFTVTGDLDVNGTSTIDTLMVRNVTAQDVYVTNNVSVSGSLTVSGSFIGVSAPQFMVGGRLTLSSSSPIISGSMISGSTVYYAPYVGNQIALYSGSQWTMTTFPETSLVLSGLTVDKNYDVFVFPKTFTSIGLELSTAWSGNNTRSNTLARQDGVLVKSADPTRRYVGTLRTTSATTTEDSVSKRFLWNFYNRVMQAMFVTDTTASWTYAVALTWRQARAITANRVEYVSGDRLDVEAMGTIMISCTTAAHVRIGVGIDSTTVNHAQLSVGFNPTNGDISVSNAHFRGTVDPGYHALNWLEYTEGGTATYFGQSIVRDPGLLARIHG